LCAPLRPRHNPHTNPRRSRRTGLTAGTRPSELVRFVAAGSDGGRQALPSAQLLDRLAAAGVTRMVR
jgi:hypothetical protein